MNTVRNALRRDLDHVMSRFDHLMHQAGDVVQAGNSSWRNKLSMAGGGLRDKWSGIDMRQQARGAVRSTDELVHAHAWKAVGMGALLGLALGFLASRMDRR
ncbi:glycine zipper domain-containing protein [Aquabacterium sp. J223]|uniref:glycine zipper domain-containing protein n=1 Tax=Aquabacterium sp. J223 TaxID=2898431 RepID=UPI0021AD6D7D|nr:hypothetical protein [Aquabacterium sp. J223]UUX96040.1 hypothetical protein LRS07_01470 [Aquabacterium sp. J223]